MSTELLSIEPEGQARATLLLISAIRLRIQPDIQEAFARVSQAVWVAASKQAIRLLLESLPHRPREQDLRVLVLETISAPNLNLLHAHFRFVAARETGVKFLPSEELSEVLEAPSRADLFIGGQVTKPGLLLYRGNLEPLTVPRSWFQTRAGGPKPDFNRFSVTDYGQTVRLGDYEAAADAVLYEFDEDYRTRAKKRMHEEDKSLGGAVRRLRLQKGLRQSDFPGISAKEIARIEKGLVKEPHAATLSIIAETTGVSVDQIHTY
jgi:Helix-turn-helix